MLDLVHIGSVIEKKRKEVNLRQRDLAARAGVSRATLEALENGRLRELGFAKLTKILSVLGLELRISDLRKPRPTLDDLLEDEPNDQGLDRRS